MLIEDTSDKLRRNLVVFSFLILIAQLFEFKLSEETQIFGVMKVHINSPIKFWFVVTFILIYFFFRYWYDQTRLDEWKKLVKELDGIKAKVFSAFLIRELRKILLRKGTSNIFNNLIFSEHLEQAYLKSGNPKTVSIAISFAPDAHGVIENYKNGGIHVNYEMNWSDGNHYGQAGGVAPDFNIPTFEYFKKYARCIFRLCTLSKSNFDLIIPVVLAVSALTVCIVKIFTV